MAFFLGLAVGVAVGAILLGRSYRDELAMRDAWERQAREVLRGVVSRPDLFLPQYVRTARHLLADEAAA